MPITYKEAKDLLNKGYKLKEQMKITESEIDFENAKKDLFEIASNLSSSRSEYSIILQATSADRQVLRDEMHRNKLIKTEARQLMLWATKTIFQNRKNS